MTDQTNQPQPAPTNEAQAQNDSNPFAKEYKSFGDFPNRRFFATSEAATLQHYLRRMNGLLPKDAEGKPTVALTQFKGEVPAGSVMGVSIIKQEREVVEQEDGKPVTRKRQVPTGVVVWPQPALDTFLADAKARKWVSDKIAVVCATEVVRPLRGKKPEEIASVLSEIPTTLDHFTAESTQGGLYGVYNDYIGPLLKEMKETRLPKSQFIKRATAAIIRDCLSSKSAAMTLAPKLEENGVFVWMIESLRITAEANDRPTQLFEDWAKDREEASLEEDEGDFDFSDLSTASIAVRPEMQEPTQPTSDAPQAPAAPVAQTG